MIWLSWYQSGGLWCGVLFFFLCNRVCSSSFLCVWTTNHWPQGLAQRILSAGFRWLWIFLPVTQSQDKKMAIQCTVSRSTWRVKYGKFASIDLYGQQLLYKSLHLGLCSVYISNVYRKLYLVYYELLCIEVMEKIEENVYLEGYNSLPLRRKNCKKYRRASDVTSVNKAVLPERRFTSVHGVEDHGIGQADCRFCLEREVHSLACSGFSSRVKYLLWLY